MDRNTMNASWVKRVQRAAWVAVAGMMASSVPAMAGDVSVGIGIRIGEPVPPPPPPPVVVVETPVYETYVVGYRRNLYDADLALRLARADEFAAYDELQAARNREAAIAAKLDETEGLIADLKHRIGDRAGDAAAIHADVVATADRCADLHRIVDALDHKIAGAREDLEASKTLGDGRGIEDARARIHEYEDKQAAKAAELRDAEGRLAHLREDEAAASTFAADRARLHDAEGQRVAIEHDLEVAHDAVYNTERRWNDARERVYVASHDRDEALWLLHRDDIIAGRLDLATCGFSIDLSVWGGHLPRDPEVIHAYCVRDVGYIRANPVFVETRYTEVTKVTEITKIREITKVREVDKVRVVERVENVKVEDRRRYAEAVVTEHKRYEAEVVERKQAAVEHRPVHVTQFVERPTHVTNVTNVTVNNGANGREVNRAREQAAEANKKAEQAQAQNVHEERALRAQQAENNTQQKELRQQQKEIDQLKAAQGKEQREINRTATAQQEQTAETSKAERSARRARDSAAAAESSANKAQSSAEQSAETSTKAERAARRARESAAAADNSAGKAQSSAEQSAEASTRSERAARRSAEAAAENSRGGRGADQAQPTDTRRGRGGKPSDPQANTDDGSRR